MKHDLRNAENAELQQALNTFFEEEKTFLDSTDLAKNFNSQQLLEENRERKTLEVGNWAGRQSGFGSQNVAEFPQGFLTK